MADDGFTLTMEEVALYGYKHAYAQMMFGGAGDDYTASRCLILNGLLMSGFPLMSQSVEKLLKTMVFLETGQETALKGLDRHNPYLLKQELQKAKDHGLDKYDELLKRLYKHFLSRYHDNKDGSRSMGSNELDEFDELWVCLLDKVQFPLEVKYRLTFLQMLFNEHILKKFPGYRLWAVTANKSLLPKLEEMEKMHIAVERHLESK